MKMRYRRNFVRAKMIYAFYKGRPVAIERIKNPITKHVLEIFNFTLVWEPEKTICGKELKKVQQ